MNICKSDTDFVLIYINVYFDYSPKMICIAKRVNKHIRVVSSIQYSRQYGIYNCPFRSSKRDWALVYTLFKLHHIKKLIPSPDRSHEN